MKMGVDLRGMTSALDADPHVDAGEAVATEEEDRLISLEAENLRLNKLDWEAIDFDEPVAALAVRHGDGRLLPAEALHGFRRRWWWWRRHDWFL